jgi:hypothetical protein
MSPTAAGPYCIYIKMKALAEKDVSKCDMFDPSVLNYLLVVLAFFRFTDFTMYLNKRYNICRCICIVKIMNE